MKKTRVLYVIGVILFLMMVWPNFVHEPIHALSAMVQGVNVKLLTDFTHIPARPVIAWTGQFTSNIGYQFFLLAPSLVALAILIYLAMSKQTYIESHIALTTYLGIELSANILKFYSEISDFRILQLLPGEGGTIIAYIATTAVLVLTGFIVARGGQVGKTNKSKETEKNTDNKARKTGQKIRQKSMHHMRKDTRGAAFQSITD